MPRRHRIVDFNELADKIAVRVAKGIIRDAGDTRSARLEEFQEYAIDAEGDVLAKSTLEALVPDVDGYVNNETLSAAVDQFWRALRPMIIEELAAELEPYADEVQALYDSFDEGSD